MRRLWMLLGGLYLIFSQSMTAAAVPAPVTLNENCVVNVLNRTIQVQPDGKWVLPNIPSTMGQIRARATCIVNGATYSGQSNYFTIVRNGVSDAGQIVFGAIEAVPQSLAFSSSSTVLNSIGQTAALTVTAIYTDGSTADVTPSTTGINYASSNSAVVTISPEGIATAIASGNVIITARKDGAVAIASVRVVLAGGDTDGDGIPDDVEISVGLNPNDPIDAFEDQDRDGLTALEEYNLGTKILVPDSDGDGIPDGVEVSGSNGFITNPLLFDTDGDGIGDGLEIQLGTDPTDKNSYNLAAALTSIEVSPNSAVLEYNVIDAEVTKQLKVTGNLLDGSTIDLTSKSRGTNYVSSDLAIASFGPVDGVVYAGQDGVALITVTNNGFETQMTLTVKTFTPVGLSWINIPGYANNVDVYGDYAYIAAGSAGMQVVDVSNPLSPFIASSLNTNGTAVDIRVDGQYAYIADASGLVIMDVSNPLIPLWVASVSTPGIAQDVMVSGNYAYLAAGLSGLQVIDISNPVQPVLVGSLGGLGWLGNAVGVDVSGTTAVLGAGNFVYTIDVSNPAAPTVLGSVSVGSIKDLVVRDNTVYTAAYTSGFHLIDITIPTVPVILGSVGGSKFVSRDVELNRGKAYFAEQLFVNAIPYVDISNPASPIFQGTIDLASLGDYAGTGIAVNNQFAYITAESYYVGLDFKASGSTRLFIAQHHTTPADAGTIAPTVSITSPTGADSFILGQTISLHATAFDDVAVASVSFYVNGQLVGSDTSGPPFSVDYTIPLDTTGLTISVDAVDYAGNIGYGSDVVLNSFLPYAGPAISIASAPVVTNAIIVGQTVTFVADASDPVGIITKVELLADGVVVASDTVAPFELTHTVPYRSSGLITYEMVATAWSGATASTSQQIYNIAPYPGPSIAVAPTPLEGVAIIAGQTASFSVNAVDPVGTISKVELLVNGTVVDTQMSAPFRFSYQVPIDATGAISFSLIATASTTASITSNTLSYNILPYPGPSISITNSPALGSPIQAGSYVTFSAAASDPVGTIVRVDLLENGVVVRSSSSYPPFSIRYQVPLDATGTISYSMQAVASTSATVLSSPMDYSVTPYTGPTMTVALMKPSGTTLYPGVSADALAPFVHPVDPVGAISKVELLVDGVVVSTARFAPYGYWYYPYYAIPVSTPDGSTINVEVRATASTGQSVSQTWTYNIATYQGPTVSIVTPPAGSSLIEGDTLTFTAQATEPGNWQRPIVEMFFDGVSAGSQYFGPWGYRYSYVVPVGVSSITAEAVATNYYNSAYSNSSGVYNYPVIPDPLTTVTGMVVDSAGTPMFDVNVQLMLPDSVVENGSASLAGGALVTDPYTSNGTSDLAGSVTFDAALASWLAQSVNLENAEAVNATGTLNLNMSGFDPMAPTAVAGTIDLYATAPSGLTIPMHGMLSNFLPAAGQQTIDIMLDVKDFVPGANPLAQPLSGQSQSAHLLGTIDVVTDPVTQAVTAMTWTLTMEQIVHGYTTTTAVDGSFAATNVPTIYRPTEVIAQEILPDGSLGRKGKASIAQFTRGGITDIGAISLPDTAFNWNFGSPLGITTAGCANTPLGFSFPYFGQLYTDVYANAEGSLTFGMCDTVFNLARISPMDYWDNGSYIPPGGDVYVKQYPDRVVVTWDLPGYFYQTPFQTADYQATLYADGRILLAYADIQPIYDDLYWCTECALYIGIEMKDLPADNIDYTVDTPWSSGLNTGIIGQVNGWGGGTMPANDSFILFTPNANGGYDAEYVAP